MVGLNLVGYSVHSLYRDTYIHQSLKRYTLLYCIGTKAEFFVMGVESSDWIMYNTPALEILLTRLIWTGPYLYITLDKLPEIHDRIFRYVLSKFF